MGKAGINKLLNIWGTILKVVVLVILGAILIVLCNETFRNYRCMKSHEQELRTLRDKDTYSTSDIRVAVWMAYQKIIADQKYRSDGECLDVDYEDHTDDFSYYYEGKSDKDTTTDYYLTVVPCNDNAYYFLYEDRKSEKELVHIQTLEAADVSDKLRDLSDEENDKVIENAISAGGEDIEELFAQRPKEIKDHQHQPINAGATVSWNEGNIDIKNGQETFSFRPDAVMINPYKLGKPE